MKRKYVAPVIAIERYELTQSIAACEIKIGLYSSQCVIKDPDSPPEMLSDALVGGFTQRGNCDDFTITGNENDGVCYNTSTNMTFAS